MEHTEGIDDATHCCDNDVGVPPYARPRATGEGGYGMGLGWENLELLELGGLTLAGVAILYRRPNKLELISSPGEDHSNTSRAA